MPKPGFWFRGFVQYAREGPGSGKDTRASPHPCVVTQEVRSGALCAPASAAVHERHSLRSLGARPYRERSKRPQCDTAGDHRRGFVHPRKSPAETGPIRAARLEEVPLPPSISSRNMSGRWPQRKSPAETGAKWVMLLANWRGPPRRSNNAGREHWLTRLGRSGAVNRRRDGISTRHKAIAVVLNLMNPVGAGRRAVGR